MNRLTDDQKSTAFVILLTVVALLLGFWVKTAVTDQTRTVTQDNFSAVIPANWVSQSGQGDIIFIARNPQQPHQSYRVRRLSSAADLAEVANEQSLQRIQLDDAFRVLDETAVIINGREGYKVSFATVHNNVTGLPRIIEGTDYYFPEDNNTLIISFQAGSDTYDEAVEQFREFLISVSYGG